MALGYIDGDDKIDAIFMGIDGKDGDNDYHYRIALDFQADSDYSTGAEAGIDEFQTWKTKREKGAGCNYNHGGGVALVHLGGDSSKIDAIFMAIDNPSGENYFKFRIAYDLIIGTNDDTDGSFTQWSDVITGESAGGHETAGGGITLAKIDSNDNWDVIFMSVVNNEGQNSYKYRIAYNLDVTTSASSPKFEKWSDIKGRMFVDGANSQGGGICMAVPNDRADDADKMDPLDLDGNGCWDAVFMHVNNPAGANDYRYRIASDFNLLDPNDDDTDGDGLYDGWADWGADGKKDTNDAGEGDSIYQVNVERCGEVGDPEQPYGDGQNWGSIGLELAGITHKAEPLVRDIYVEVDSMVGYNLDADAKSKAIACFSKYAINLHIDEGSMLGGNQIQKVAPLSFDIKTGNNNDFYDFKWGNGWDVNGNEKIDADDVIHNGNFAPKRRGIFHYCIVGYNYEQKTASLGISDGYNDFSFPMDY